MYSETTIKFTLAKTEKEILEKASDILSTMCVETNNINSDYLDKADEVLEDIIDNIEPTDDSDTYVYVFE
jgi:transposase